MKTIDTLVEDMYAVIDGNGGWDATISEYFRKELGNVVDTRLGEEDQPRGTLRMSNLGTPCRRKLWYEVNRADEGEPLSAPTKLKFLYGDILESLLLSVAKAAGHDVRGEQTELSIAGIKGHRDAVIDGITIDVKSAAPYSFQKFANGQLRSDDPFGYISQLSSYVYAGHRDTPDEVHPTLGGFLVVDKVNGKLCYDEYDFSEEIQGKEEEAQRLIDMVAGDMPDRSFAPVPDGSSGNMKLGVNCSYCSFKKVCYPHLRTFLYSNGPRFLTHVARLPNVPEA